MTSRNTYGDQFMNSVEKGTFNRKIPEYYKKGDFQAIYHALDRWLDKKVEKTLGYFSEGKTSSEINKGIQRYKKADQPAVPDVESGDQSAGITVRARRLPAMALEDESEIYTKTWERDEDIVPEVVEEDLYNESKQQENTDNDFDVQPDDFVQEDQKDLESAQYLLTRDDIKLQAFDIAMDRIAKHIENSSSPNTLNSVLSSDFEAALLERIEILTESPALTDPLVEPSADIEAVQDRFVHSSRETLPSNYKEITYNFLHNDRDQARYRAAISERNLVQKVMFSDILKDEENRPYSQYMTMDRMEIFAMAAETSGLLADTVQAKFHKAKRSMESYIVYELKHKDIVGTDRVDRCDKGTGFLFENPSVDLDG